MATVPASDIQSLGNSSVTVFNPAQGGGTSAASTFTTYLSILTNDLVYDASRKLLWASVPSSAGSALGNTVVSIDPLLVCSEHPFGGAVSQTDWLFQVTAPIFGSALDVLPPLAKLTLLIAFRPP